MSTYTHLFDLPGFDYEKILRYAKKIDYSNYMDLAHDHILTGKSMQTLKFYYKTVNEVDYTINEDTCKVCEKCNEIKPIAGFRRRNRDGKIYIENICKSCNTEKNIQRKIKSKNHIMKLVKIEVPNGKNNRRPTLTFSKKGLFSINPAMSDLIKLRPGDKVVFLKDEEKPKNWYITKSKEDGFPIQITTRGKYTSRKFQKRPLYEIMKKTLGLSETSNSFSIGPETRYEGDIYYQLILNKA